MLKKVCVKSGNEQMSDGCEVVLRIQRYDRQGEAWSFDGESSVLLSSLSQVSGLWSWVAALGSWVADVSSELW